MIRRLSLWCTGLILLIALASLGIAGCGGGAGSSGTSSQDLFGNLNIRVTREEGPTRAQVREGTILLSTSSSAQRLLVELYPLPLQTPPAPLVVRSFNLVDGKGQVVIDQIPAPAHYQVRGYLFEGASTEYSASFMVEDIEILPGVLASASTWLTPRPSGSPTPTPTPTPSPTTLPGVPFTVDSGAEPQVAMRADGQFVVSWQAGKVRALGFNASPTPVPLWSQPVVVSEDTNCESPAPAINSSGLFGVAWLVKFPSPQRLMAAYRNLETGGPAGGPQEIYNSSDVPGEELDWVGFGMCEASSTSIPAPIVALLRTSSINSISSFFVLASDPIVTWPRDNYPQSVPLAAPNLDVDANGHCAQVFYEGTNLQLRLSQNHETNTATITTVDGTGWLSRPSVAIRNGRIAVVWGSSDPAGSGLAVFLQRFQYDPGATILTPVALDPEPIKVSEGLSGQSHLAPDVAMDGRGNCVVVWRYWEGSSLAQIVGRPVNANGSLHPVFQASNDDQVEHDWPSVGMDSAGNFVVCWGVENGGFIKGCRYASCFPQG